MRARSVHDVHRDLSNELRIAGNQYKDLPDLHRLATSTFVVGNMVWLLRHHIATARPCAKPDYKKLA